MAGVALGARRVSKFAARALGSAIKPSSCIRSIATRQLISLSPPSGFNQPSCWQTRWDSAVRDSPGTWCDQIDNEV